jgi:hypothetical protein
MLNLQDYMGQQPRGPQSESILLYIATLAIGTVIYSQCQKGHTFGELAILHDKESLEVPF